MQQLSHKDQQLSHKFIKLFPAQMTSVLKYLDIFYDILIAFLHSDF